MQTSNFDVHFITWFTALNYAVFKVESEKAAMMQESYYKRLNVLIHGVEEVAWVTHENPLKTEQKAACGSQAVADHTYTMKS